MLSYFVRQRRIDKRICKEYKQLFLGSSACGGQERGAK